MTHLLENEQSTLPTGWKFVQMADVVQDTQYGTADKANSDGNGLPILRMNNITYSGQIDLSDIKWCPIAEKDEKKFTVAKGDLLFNRTNSPELVGKTAVWNREEQYAFAGYLVRVRFQPDIALSKYVSLYLNSPHGKAYLFGKAKPSNNMSNFSASEFLKIPLPLPPIAEQKRIAAILDKAEELRGLRRKALGELDAIVQSIFLEMFGDPATNPKEWKRKFIKQIGQVITGNTPPRAQPELYGNAIEWVKSDNINTPYNYLTKASEGLSEAGKAIARTVPPSSILVTCIAGTPDCIGNAAIADREVAFNQQINAVVPQIGDFRFLYTQILVNKRLVQEASTSSMKGMVSKSRFEEIQLIFPPVNLQQAFGESFDKIEQLKATHRESLAQLDALFTSLQHRAFRGEL